jgi:hypothetical protein
MNSMHYGWDETRLDDDLRLSFRCTVQLLSWCNVIYVSPGSSGSLVMSPNLLGAK